MTATSQASKGLGERLAAAVRCTGVQLAATHLPARSPSVAAQHFAAVRLILLALPTMAVDWQIASTWALPAWIPVAGACLLGVLIVIALARPEWKPLAAAAVV